MSLLNNAYEDVVLMDKRREPDGEGGFITNWVESVIFKAAITFDTSMQSRIGEKQGVSSRYTVTANKGAKLVYGDVIKRLRDGKIFRITSDGDDKMTPKSASFQFLQVTAEEYVLE